MDDKDIVKACREVLAEASCNSYNNCNYVFLQQKGCIQQHIGRVCYSQLRVSSVSHLSLCIPQYKEARFSSSPKEMKRLIAYLDWIIKESPWKKAFLYPEQSSEVYLNDGLAMNTNECSQYVVGAMTALRAAWEYPYFLDAWDKFQELKFSKETSFILANLFDKNGKQSNPNTNHATFERESLYKDNFFNFKKGIFPKYEKRPPMNKDALEYRGIFSLFQGKATNLFIDHVTPFCKKKGEGWSSSYSYDLSPEFVKTVKEFVDE